MSSPRTRTSRTLCPRGAGAYLVRQHLRSSPTILVGMTSSPHLHSLSLSGDKRCNLAHSAQLRESITSLVSHFMVRRHISVSHLCEDVAGFVVQVFQACAHRSLQSAMVRAGFFPSAPRSGGYGYSLDLLDLFLGLSKRSSISTTGMAAALHEGHCRRGFVLLNRQVRIISNIGCDR